MRRETWVTTQHYAVHPGNRDVAGAAVLRFTFHISRLAALLLLVACGSDPQGDELRASVVASLARGEEQSAVAFRFPTSRAGTIQVYRLPGMEATDWRFTTPGLVVDRVVGFAPDDDRIYLLSPTGHLMALDLTTGRTRTADTGVVAAVLGPTGTPFFARARGAVGSVTGRTATTWNVSTGQPEAMFGTTSNRLVVISRMDGNRVLQSLTAGQPPQPRPIPDGPMTLSQWGDVAAVATDTGVVVYELLRTGRSRVITLRETVTAVAFSPSAHRIYLGTPDGTVLVADRFEGRILERFDAGGAVDAIRPDPQGRLFLARRAGQDTVMAISVTHAHEPVKVYAEWADDLPQVALGGGLVVRRGSDVLSLAPVTFQEIGRATGGARDRWLVAIWDPRRPVFQLASQETREETTTEQVVYIQVSSTRNPAWAEQLAQDLRAAGMRASVLPPADLEEIYRVVIGPYSTRDEAEVTGRRLGMPFWVFTREAPSTEP